MASSTATVVDARGADQDLGGWLDGALSVITTVGKIAGTLAGTSFTDYGPLGRGVAPELGSVVFSKNPDSGDILAQNQDPDHAVCFDFPGDIADGGAAETLTVPASSTFNISPAFVTASQADVDTLGITPCGESAIPGRRAGRTPTTVRASGTNVPASSVAVKLGSYLSVKLTGSNRTVQIATLAGFTLVGIVLLNIRGAGDTVARIVNPPKPSTDGSDPGSLDIVLPAGIDIESSSGLSYVEVIANVVESGSDGISRHVGVPMTDEDRARLVVFAASR